MIRVRGEAGSLAWMRLMEIQRKREITTVLSGGVLHEDMALVRLLRHDTRFVAEFKKVKVIT